MKRVKKPKVGMEVGFPFYCREPWRMGWNGWEFKKAIITKIYTSTKNFQCVELTYADNGKEQIKRVKIEENWPIFHAIK